MGIDFIRRIAPSFKKAWDRRRVELCTPDLFTRPVIEGSRTAIAQMIGKKRLITGQDVIIDSTSSDLICRIGIETVARFSEPSTTLRAATAEAAGVAIGRVEAVNEISGTVEISFS